MFATGWFREERLLLRAADAGRCLYELHARCPNATAVYRDEILPPRNATLRPYHQLRLAQTLVFRAVIALASGTVTVVGIVALFFARPIHELTDLGHLARASVALAILIPVTPALFAYGVVMLRHAPSP